MVYASVQDAEERRTLEELCRDLKLETLELRKTRDLSGKGATDVLIGPDAGKLRKAGKSYKNVLSLEWGLSLDYPECCVKAYLDWNASGGAEDLVRYIYGRTGKTGPVPFWMNNTLNFFSRIKTPEMRRDYLEFSKLNSGRDREGIVTWHPCSYSCAATLKKGKLVYDFLSGHMPRTAAYRKALLSRPVLFKDLFRFAFLDGTCRAKNGGIAAEYTGVSFPVSLLGKAVLGDISSRRRIETTPRGQIAGPKSRLLEDFILLPFSAPR